MTNFRPAIVLLCLSPSVLVGADDLVVLTGATGQTGALVYKLLKDQGVPTRAFVRNVTKAKERLGCSKCDASEGIFVGDITKPETMVDVMDGAGALVILTSAAAVCDPFPNCHFNKGAYPVDIDFHGGQNQVKAFAESAVGKKNIVLVSSMLTTMPNNPIDKEGNGFMDFYKLNLEAFLMSAGFPFTILKPCGLATGEPLKDKLVVAHDDQGNFTRRGVQGPTMQRGDLARVVVAAAVKPELAEDLRFDICGDNGSPTKDADIPALFNTAKLPWQDQEQIIV